MNIHNIYMLIQQTGGCTVSTYYKKSIAGLPLYAVAGYPEHEQIIPLKYWSIDVLKDYLITKKDLLNSNLNCLGVWIDTTSNLVYLDISIVVSSQELAEQLAQTNNQIAYFCLETMTEIKTQQRNAINE